MGGGNPAQTPRHPMTLEEEMAVGLAASRRDLPFTDEGVRKSLALGGSLDATFADDRVPESLEFLSVQRGGFRPGAGHVSRLTGAGGSDMNGRAAEW